MRKPIFDLLYQYTLQLIQLVAGIGFYDHVVADVEKQKTAALVIYNEFKEEAENQEYFKKLSMQEQQALGQNEINYRTLLKQMDETMSYLLKQKWTKNIQFALWYLDDTRIHIESINTPEEISRTAKATTLVNLEKFDKADYLDKLPTVITAIDTLTTDIMAEGVFIVNEATITSEFHRVYIESQLKKTAILLQQELEDVEVNGLPHLHQYPLPEIVVPEIPDIAPEPKKEDVKQMELPIKEIVKSDK